MSTRLDRTAEGMRRTFGCGAEGVTCGWCQHFQPRPRTWEPNAWACLKAPTTTGAHGKVHRAVWSKRWQACALFVAKVPSS